MSAIDVRLVSSLAAAALLAGLLGAGHARGAARAPAQAPGPAATDGTTQRTLRFAGAGPHAIDVRTIHGFIHVSASTDDAVHVEAQRQTSFDTEAGRQAAAAVTLDFVDNAPTIQMIVREPRGIVCGERNHFRGPWRPRYEVTFDLTIRVPPGTRLRLCTINDGDIRVQGTSGDFQIDNVNGAITVEALRGSGSAETVNGPVSASFLQAPGTASLFKTVNGDVDVTFPPTLSAELRLKTFNGGLFTDFDVDPLPPAPPTRTRRNGMFVYRSGEFTRARVGDGGPQITLDTFNGDVRVRRAAR